MKKEPTPRHKMLLSLVLLFLAVAAAVGGTAAVYTSQVFQRSVVRNRDTEAIRFSSDKLYRVANVDQPPKIYYYPVSKGQKTMSFTVCNYDQSKKAVVNQQDLDYDIKFQVKEGTDGFKYLINENSDTGIINNGELSLYGTLSSGRQSKDTYTISFSEKDYGKVKVTVTVIPRDPSLTKDKKLYTTLIPIEYATTQGVKLEWEFTDEDEFRTPDMVDAYNVAVSISGGEDDVVICWEKDELDIDPFFLEKMTESGGTYELNGTKYVLTIHMNSEDATAAYLFQFYKHGSGSSDWRDIPIEIYNLKSLETDTNDVPKQGDS